ncbi:hypothetical protein HB364_19390 [Pseudoflavitalea sp. X16]|uniref:hypothetical protein n=1 Tax=Paraflavitalea devenefica TaxID=2716334 RepID=UPI0014215B3A|nr:hypothetical protein [Paraflavitalea devenefica]NII27262.1 hypothetical protein [Paraflavitalea devenefica]
MKPENSILKVLAWFDLFNYPLTAAEIHFFLDRQLPKEELKAALGYLVEEKTIFRMDSFYSLQQEEWLITRRTNGNRRAQQLLKVAHRVSRLLYHFPYVRGIGISGSLSKNFADEKADIDLFIITSPNRMWIARTIMHLFKKFTYLLGKQHWFCMNYYIDEEALQIEEQNIFTATELITFMPVCGNGAISHFFHANNWAKNFYPNYADRMPLYKDTGKGYLVKKLFEYLLNNRLGDRLDEYLMKLTTRRWKQKEEKRLLNMRGVRLGLTTGKHCARPNPSFFQKSILEQYQQKLEAVYARQEKLRVASCEFRAARLDPQ